MTSHIDALPSKGEGKPAFTPGPWVADDFCMQDGRQVRVGTTDGSPHYYHRTATICEAYVKHPRLGDEMDVGEPAIGIITAEANARLIAAAPDLYAAADEAHAFLSIIPPTSRTAEAHALVAKLRAALSLARGEPSNG